MYDVHTKNKIKSTAATVSMRVNSLGYWEILAILVTITGSQLTEMMLTLEV